MQPSSRWEEIPSDLLGLVLSRLSVVDHIRSSAVSTSWEKTASEHPPAKSNKTVAWLMLADVDEDHRLFYSIHEQKIYQIHLPQIRGWRFIGSCDGWLVAIDSTPHLHVLNPVTGFRAPLPPITAFNCVGRPKLVDGEITGYFVREGPYDRNFVFNNMDHMREKFVSKAIYFPSASVAIAIYSVFGELAFARIGDDSWTQIKLKEECNEDIERCLFDDFILHKGIFYAVNGRGYMYGFDLNNVVDGTTTPKITFEGPDGSHIPLTRNTPHYLVESGGDLLLICRETSVIRPLSYFRYNHMSYTRFDRQFVCKTEWFKVYKLDRARFEWVQIKCLGEVAIFIGFNHSMSLSTVELPELKANCIYFTESTIDDIDIMTVPSKPLDMGVYNLEDGTLESFFPKGGKLLRHLSWPPSVWITPSLT